MDDRKDFDGDVTCAIRDDVLRAWHNKLPCVGHPSGATGGGEFRKFLHSVHDQTRLPSRCRWSVLGDPGLKVGEIAQRPAGPPQSHSGGGRGVSVPQESIHATT